MNNTEKSVKKFTQTETFAEILDVSQRLTFDPAERERLIEALAQTTINLTIFIENKDIAFNCIAAEEELHGLLAIMLKMVSPDPDKKP